MNIIMRKVKISRDILFKYYNEFIKLYPRNNVNKKFRDAQNWSNINSVCYLERRTRLVFSIWRGRLISRHICGGGLDPRGPRFFSGDNERAGDVEHGVQEGCGCLLTRAPNNPLPDLASVKKFSRKIYVRCTTVARRFPPTQIFSCSSSLEGTFFRIDKQTLCTSNASVVHYWPSLSLFFEGIEEGKIFYKIGKHSCYDTQGAKRYLYDVNLIPDPSKNDLIRSSRK